MARSNPRTESVPGDDTGRAVSTTHAIERLGETGFRLQGGLALDGGETRLVAG
jgi:hypothetical protein